MPFKVLRELVKKLICETDEDCSSSIDSDEENYSIQTTDREFTYASIELSFLIGLGTNKGIVICYNSKSI